MRSSGVYWSEVKQRLRSVLEARASWVVVLVIVAIQILVSVAGGHEALPGLFTTMGLSREGMAEGKIWQPVTYGLLHGGFLHVTINSLCILLVGSRVEYALGKGLILKTVLAGVVGGAIGHLMLDDSGPLVGISGGCVSLLILLTTLSPDSKVWPIPVSARSLGIGVMTVELVLALMDLNVHLPVISTLRDELERLGLSTHGYSVGHACHFGGGFAGFLMGLWLLRPRVTIAALRRERERREAKKIKPNGA